MVNLNWKKYFYSYLSRIDFSVFLKYFKILENFFSSLNIRISGWIFSRFWIFSNWVNFRISFNLLSVKHRNIGTLIRSFLRSTAENSYLLNCGTGQDWYTCQFIFIPLPGENETWETNFFENLFLFFFFLVLGGKIGRFFFIILLRIIQLKTYHSFRKEIFGVVKPVNLTFS